MAIRDSAMKRRQSAKNETLRPGNPYAATKVGKHKFSERLFNY